MNTIKIGWGRRSINIDAPDTLPGQMYLRVSEGILDPLYATALCIDSGEGQDVAILCNQVGSKGGQVLVNETLHMLNKAYN